MKEAALLLGSGLGMIAVAVLAWAVWKGQRVTTTFWLWGALAWVVAVALKVAWAVPLNPRVVGWLTATVPANVANPLLWSYLGILTGVFECGFTLLLVRSVGQLRVAAWPEAVAFGIAFGAAEALVVGAAHLAQTVAQIAGVLPGEALPSGYNLAWAVAPLVERASAILVHVLSAVLIFYSVRTGRVRWFWLSFLYKSAVDTVAAYGLLSYGVTTLSRVWTMEGVFALFAAAGLWGTARMRWWPAANRPQ